MRKLKIFITTAALALTMGVATAGAATFAIGGDIGAWGGGDDCPPAGIGAPCVLDDTMDSGASTEGR